MANCKSNKYVGRSCVLEYAIGCGDKLPEENEFKKISAMRAKSMTLEWDTIDATADDSKGGVRENLAGYQTFSISGSGVCKAAGEGSKELIQLTKHVANPTATNGQPYAWLRLTFLDVTFTAFCIITNMGREAPHDDVVTYSLEASLTASDFGLLVKDTVNKKEDKPEPVQEEGTKPSNKEEGTKPADQESATK